MARDQPRHRAASVRGGSPGRFAGALSLLASAPVRWTAWGSICAGLLGAGASSDQRWRAVRGSLAWALIGFGIVRMLAPMLARWDTFGFHDWDVATAYRYITVKSLLEYGEAPWWHPWLCGGFPAFGYIEGATNFLSPYLPLYLLTEIRTAIRLEVLGATFVGAAGSYFLAGRFTGSSALRALVALLFMVNGRWSLQVATGHTWHLQFCWLPWALYFFDQAMDRGRLRRVIPGAVCVACTALFGGIYPLPYTALALTFYGILSALLRCSWRPLAALLLLGPLAAGLAAPKLLPVLDAMARAPRLIDSPEVIGLSELVVMLTDPTQRYGAFPVRVPAYNWHEWGIYIGTVPMFLLGLGIVFARGAREQAFKVMGLLYLLLGFGAFHRHAPWALLHELPVFSSLHVPSRFHYPMLLFLSLAFVGWVAPLVERGVRRHPWLDALLLVPLLWGTLDITTVSSRPLGQAFWMEKPDEIPRAQFFEHRAEPVVHYRKRDWAPPVLLPMMANTGVIKCYGVPESFPVGATGADSPGYPGRAYVAQGEGRVEVLDWSPNHVRLRVSNGSPGALLVYNMNFDSSWKANGLPAESHHDQVATRLAEGGNTEVEFRYFPRTLPRALLVFALTVVGMLAAPSVTKRIRLQRQHRAAPQVSRPGEAG